MKQETISYLSALSNGPRTLRSFCCDTGVYQSVVQHHIDILIEAGYAERTGSAQAMRYGITAEGEAFLAHLPPPVQSRVICNASMREPLRQPAWPQVRAGADDHMQANSLGSWA